MRDSFCLIKQMKKGFTLVEVTVALAIFGISVVVLTQSFLGGMFSLESFKFDSPEDDAFMFVYDRVISLNKQNIESGGSITLFNKGVAKWGGAVQTTLISGLYKVTLNVSFAEDKKSSLKNKNYTESFYIYRPEWPESQEAELRLKSKGSLKS